MSPLEGLSGGGGGDGGGTMCERKEERTGCCTVTRVTVSVHRVFTSLHSLSVWQGDSLSWRLYCPVTDTGTLTD